MALYTYFLKSERIYTQLITGANGGEKSKEAERKDLGFIEISQGDLGSILHALIYFLFYGKYIHVLLRCKNILSSFQYNLSPHLESQNFRAGREFRAHLPIPL